MIPVLVHLVLAMFNLTFDLQPKLRRIIAAGLEAGGRGDVVGGTFAVRLLCMWIAFAVVAPIAALNVMLIYYDVIGFFALDLFEGFARLVGAI
jgi:hypothetical protein